MMSKPLEDVVTSAIIKETICTIPAEWLRNYRDLPGRSPSENSKYIADIVRKLSDDEVIRLVRDVADATIFSILYLIDNQFKNEHIKTTFDELNADEESFGRLIELYRHQVDPGGIIVTPLR